MNVDTIRTDIPVSYTHLDVYKRQVLPFADEVHEHTSVYQLNELDFMYRQLSADMQEEYITPVSYTHLAKVLCFMIPTSLKNYVVKATKASNLFHRLRLSFPEIRLWLI